MTQPAGLGAGTGSRFALDGITLGLYLDDDAQGVSCTLVAKLDNARVVLAGSDQDGVVGKILGGKDLQLPFPIGLTWSSRTGFSITLGPGTLDVPGTVTLGPVRLDHLALALGAADHSLSARVSARVAVSLGPIAVMLDQLGGAVTLDRSVDGALGLGALSASAVLPTGAGLAIDAGAVKGSGVITRDPASGRYSGGPDVASMVRQALGDTSSWQSQPAAEEPSWLVLATTTTGKMHPLGPVVVRQHVVPFGIPLSEFGNVPLETTTQFEICSVTVGVTAASTTPVTDAFAPGQFMQLSNDQKLEAPSFERFDSGIVIGGHATSAGPLARASLNEETLVIDPLAPPPVSPTRTPITWTVASGLGAVRPSVRLPSRSGPQLGEIDYVLASTATLAKAGIATPYTVASAARTGGLQVIAFAHAS